ncbi:tRNA-2-methylthio-N(6)-dimethylallyladenosine synthase [Gracilariopsis chorda]|uniref:tRNA-2-methylthio-N(6)-dimethylallyladenosine synthase n=1 Tax=Gracilariopsis chorda TaxID=448386 RepID=A0A2V3J037_9FLOR|nr:tRNA-2-methylthio-N(6)-dimethylallyladenosine synthase [Gracilariopsis chorda]|eukprot:PXF47772.1 tRNA-2-methylthio-N(6)-dimethylallyladenosine synthase [Gracilariopsis chorda]
MRLNTAFVAGSFCTPLETFLPQRNLCSRQTFSESGRKSIVAVIQQERTPRELNRVPRPGVPGHRFHNISPDDIEAIRIRHCRLETKELCDQVWKQITRDKARLADVAASLSTCNASKHQGGDLGWWWKEEIVPENVEEFGINDQLLAAALRSRPHTLERVQTKHGWHVFIVEEARHVLRTKHERTASRQNPNRKRGVGVNGEQVPRPLPHTYAVQTLGCQMNRSDSERMAGELNRLGYTETSDPFQASLLILNTCNIREHAESKVYSYVGRHVMRKRMYPNDVTLCVAGCVAQQEGEKMLRRIPELDLVFGPQYVNRLGDLLTDVERNGCQVAATDPTHIQEDISKPKRESSVSAWINVIYGCGENCSFCTVGNVVRSVEQSRSMESIRSEIEEAARDGYREIVLLGQNIDAYGRDMYPKRTFSQLLDFIHDIDGIERIRFTTSHPRYISQNLVDMCATLPRVMPFFHIPPQSGDNDVLKAMRRGYTVEAYEAVVKRIRKSIPDAAICGDMIVGFPGETEEQFQKSLELMDRVKFDVMNTAAYSPRPQTPAALMENQVPDAVKMDRLYRMNEVVKAHALERSLRYIGRTELVLVEHQNPKNARQVVGRTPTNRSVYFDGSIEELRGKIVSVEIEDAYPFSLKGRRPENPY